MSNPEGRIKIKTKGKRATENALKIMKAFDVACIEIGVKEKKESIPSWCKGCDYNYHEDCTEGCHKIINEEEEEEF